MFPHMAPRAPVYGMVCLLHGAAAAAGAAASAEPLTLGQALERIGASSEEIAVAQAGLDEAGQRVRVARSAFYPSLIGSIGYLRTIESQFDFDFAPMDPEMMLDLGELPFGQPNQWTFTLQASWNVYRGGADAARLRAARAQESSARVAFDAARAQLILDVTAAYYDAQLAGALVTIAETALAQAEETLRQIELGAREGTRAEFELVRARVARDNARPAVIQAGVDRDLAWARFRALVNLPPGAQVELTTTLEVTDEDQTGDPGEDPATAATTQARAPVEQAEAALLASEASARAALGARLPSVTVSSTYSQIAYPSGVVPGPDDFRADWNVGATLEVPLFTGGRLVGEVAASRAAARAARARLQPTRELAAVDTQAAILGRRAALATWRSSEGTVEEARRALELATLRHQEGLSTLLELDDSRLQLERAEANRARAVRDLKVARTRLSLLRNLPLAQAVAP